MAGFLDSIESSFNSLLEPLTSGLAPETSTARKSTSATSASQTSTTIRSSVRTSSTVSSITSTSSSTSSQPTSSPSRTSSSRSTSSSTTDSSSSFETTLSTSTTSTSSEITSETSSTTFITSTTSVQTTPAAPAASATQSAIATAAPKDTGSGISTAGIAVAVVFGAALIASIIYLTLRFCPAIRKRLDAFYQRRRNERSYREALDGPAVPKKDERHSLDSSVRSRADSAPRSLEYEKSRISMAAAKELNLPQRPLSSFFALGRNPDIQSNTAPAYQSENRGRNPRFSWEVQDNPVQHGVVHPQYTSLTSARPEDPRGQGLGLGRVSLLRNHSLLRKAGYDVPPKLPGPSTTAAQAEIAIAGAVRIVPGKKEATSPIRALEIVKPAQQHEIRRKPVGSAPHIASMVKDQYQPRSQPQLLPAERSRERSPTPPRLNIDIPLTPVSQIGMAVSGTPRSAQGGHAGFAH